MAEPIPPTQVQHPNRATFRTFVQGAIGLLLILPVIVPLTGLDVAALPWLGVALAISAAVARLMANPAVDAWLRHYAPWLATSPRA